MIYSLGILGISKAAGNGVSVWEQAISYQLVGEVTASPRL